MIGRVLALAIGLFSGLAGAQMPEFAQQYRQRLGGAVDELRRVVTRLDDDARASNMSRDEAIQKLEDNADPLVHRRGEADREVVARLGRLEQQRAAYDSAGPFTRLVIFVRDADPGLSRATYLDYEPAWPATTEGAAAGGAGFVFGWGVLLLVSRMLGRLFSGGRRRPGALRSA